jgi:hypothetical protein
VISDKLGMQEVLDVFDRQGLIGIWTAHQESEIVGDPNCSRAGHGNEFSWRLSIPTVKAAFMDSQERISLYLPISPYISLYLPPSWTRRRASWWARGSNKRASPRAACSTSMSSRSASPYISLDLPRSP